MVKRMKLSTLSLETIERNQNKKVKAANEIILHRSLKEIPSEYWDKVEVDNNWDKEYLEAERTKERGGNKQLFPGGREIPMMFSDGVDDQVGSNNACDGKWDRKFKSQRILDNFRKYADLSKIDIHGAHDRPLISNMTVDKWIRIHRPSQLTKALREAKKMFHNPAGYGKVKEKEAFEFLKSIISSSEITANIKFTPGQEFTLGEWLKHRTSIDGEIEVMEQEVWEWQLCYNPQHQGLEKKNQQFQEISSLLFPSQPYDFIQFKQEIIQLKFKELAPQVRDKRTELEQLITNAKNKVEINFTGIIDLLLEMQKQTVKQGSNDLIQGQLTAYKNILETKLSKEELQTLLNKQTELYQLEKHLESLQQNQQTAQIQQNVYPAKK